jgi:ABC-type transporter Mla subunit MlaD
MTGSQPVQRKETVVEESPLIRAAAELHTRVDRLINKAEAKFQYICDIQGDTLQNPDTLTLVVNAHGAVFGELIRTVGALGAIVEESLKTQEAIMETVRALSSNARGLDDALDRLTRVVDDASKRVPE